MRRLLLLAAITITGVISIWGGTSLALRNDGGGAGALIGTFDMQMNVADDPSGHQKFIQMPSELPVQVIMEGPEMVLTGPFPWVPVTAQFTEGEFMATGTGTVATNPDIAVSFQGMLTAEGPVGTYSMGVNGGLPGGQAIDYEVKPPPPEQFYTITVLKRHDDTKRGLPGWEFNFYPGPGCTGNPLVPPPSSPTETDADGILEFGGLDAGTYSVEEKPQAGWNVVGEDCQDVSVPGTAGTGGGDAVANDGPVPSCPVTNDPFPAAGCDEFSSIATVKLELTNPPFGDLACDLSGPTQIVRGPVVGGTLDTVATEIVFMKLVGSCEPGSIEVTLRESPTFDSDGLITEQKNNDPGTLEFPADSFFDIFFEVDSPIGKLHNETGLRMECKITEIPPFGCFYEPDIGEIQLFDVTDKKVGRLIHASHIPIDPKKVLVIFVNAPKLTPTPTMTPNPSFDEKITVPLTFYQLNGSDWNSDTIKALLSHANDIWSPANINFTWPNQPTLHPLADPATAQGDKGDVFDDTETDQVCDLATAARDTGKPGTFPVILVGELSGLPGQDWGVATIKPGADSGLCVLLTDDIKHDPEPKLGETLAHEMGHAMCLDHTDIDPAEMKTDPDDTNNLLHPTAKPTGNKLTKQQMTAARACALELLSQIQGTPTPTPTPADGDTPTPTPTATLPSGDTPTPTATQTEPPAPPTSTPTPTGDDGDGDVNCDGVADSRDALLVLQYSAGLIDTLPCEGSADVNGDGVIDSRDAALILQADAGFVTLPL